MTPNLIECQVRAIDGQKGRIELIRRNARIGTLPPFVEQDFLIGISDRVARFDVNRASFAFQPGDIVLLNPGQVVSCETLSIPENGTTYRGIQIEPALMNELMREAGCGTPGRAFFTRPVATFPDLGAQFEETHQVLLHSESRTDTEEALLALIRRLLGPTALLRAESQPELERRAVRRVRELVRTMYASRLTLDQMARVADLSSSRLSRVFQAETGVSPHAYVIQYRINRAKALLSCGTEPARTAVETGFVDQAHLTRHFKRYTALTPGKYARLSRRVAPLAWRTGTA